MSVPQDTPNRQTNDKQPEMVQESENSPARVSNDVAATVDTSVQQQQKLPQITSPTPAASSSHDKSGDQVSTSSKPDHASIKIPNIAQHEQTDPRMGDSGGDISEDHLAPWYRPKRNERSEKGFKDVLNASRSECYRILKEVDDATIKGWKEEVDTLLVFAGLFSAVVTTFSVQTYPALIPPSPDPSAAILAQISAQLSGLQINGQSITSTVPPAQNPAATSAVPGPLVVVNVLWFTSLIFSLVSASIGILLKQWLREYENVTTNASDHKLRVWQVRHEGLVRWRVKELVMLLPLLLQIALIMFLVGLVELTWTLNSTVAAFVTTFVSVALVFTAITTILPSVVLACPYKSPQARLFFHLWQWSKSLFEVVFKDRSYMPLHDWSKWEDLYISHSWFVLDAHILQAVRTAYVGVTSQKLYATVGPIAVNALCINWAEFDNAGPSGELAKSLSEHLDVTEGYCDYSEDSFIPTHLSLLHGLALLLRWDQFQERSWSLIRGHGHRFDIEVGHWGELPTIIQFVKKQISDGFATSPNIEFMEGSRTIIRLSARSDYWFTTFRDELRQFLEFLGPHVRDVSRFVPGDENWNEYLISFLQEFFLEILELAQKHNDAVMVDFVCACEDGFKGLDEKLANDQYWPYCKSDIEDPLEAIRKLVDEQQAVRDSWADLLNRLASTDSS